MRTLHKLILLAVIVLVVTAGLGGLYYARVSLSQARAADYKPEGLQLLSEGAYADAMDRLGRYIHRHPDDAEALYAYSQARRNVAESDGEHVVQAIGALRDVRRLDPEHSTAKRELLELYLRVGFGSETISLAEEILEQEPKDWDAMSARVQALVRTQRSSEALAAAEQMAQVHPSDVRAHLNVLTLMQRRGRGDLQIVQYAMNLDEEQVPPATRKFLVGAAHQITGNTSQAQAHFREAAQDPPADAHLLQRLAAALDRAGAFELASDAVRRGYEQAGDANAELRSLHVTRLLQLGRTQAAMDALEGVDIGSDQADAQLLVLKAVALSEAGEHEPVLEIAANLSRRPADPVAEAWAPLLELRGADQQPSNAQIIEICTQARQILPEDPFLALMLGRAYAAAGEEDLALSTLHEASRLASAAPRPLAVMAQVYNSQSRHRHAAGAAREALSRSPQNVDAAVQLAVALANHPEPPEDAALLQLVDAIQSMRPGEPRTLPVQVQLLARTGQVERATDILEQILDAEQTPGEQMLLRLARAAEPMDAELAQRLVAHSEQRHGLSPRLAAMRAMEAQQEQGDEAGLAILDGAEPENVQSPAHLQWRYYRAHYLEGIGHEDARAAWEAVIDAGPTDVDLLQTVLEARSVQADRGLQNRVIGQLQEQTGDGSTLWRMARARWWLASPENPEEAAAEAALLLNRVVRIAPDNAEAHWLLANALNRLGNERGVLEHLQRTVRLDPDRVDAVLALVGVLQARGEYNAAQPHLDRLDGRPLTAQQRRRLSTLWLARGDTERAVQVLQAGRGEEAAPSREDDLLLAQLHLHRDEIERSDELLEQVLADPELGSRPGTLRFAADFYAFKGEPERAKQMLDSLEQIEDLTPAARHLVLAGHAAGYGDPEQARQHYEEAVDAMPERAATWHEYLRWLIGRGDGEAVVEVAARAADAVAGDEGLAALAGRGELVGEAVGAPILRPLVASFLSERSEYREVADALLSEAVAVQQGESDGEQIIADLPRLAERHPRFLALQNLAAQILTAVDRYDQAIRVATRTAEAFPNESTPLELAAEAMVAAERWDEAISIANRWKQRAPGQAAQADMAIARARLGLGRPGQALTQLEPHLEPARARPGEHLAFLDLYSQALVLAGDEAAASDLLMPLAEDYPQVRSTMRSLVRSRVADADVAEAWLERLGETAPADAIGERANNALAWFQAGQRLDRSDFHDRCRTLVQRLSEEPDAPAAVFVLRGELAQINEDWPVAEASFRQVLQLQPENAVAKNNLAVALLEQDRQLLYAVELASAAAEALPQLPEAHNTHARVLLKVGEYADAIAASRRATEAAPDALRWEIELIWTLAQASELDEAAARFEQARLRTAELAELPESARERFEQINQLLADAAVDVDGDAEAVSGGQS